MKTKPPLWMTGLLLLTSLLVTGQTSFAQSFQYHYDPSGNLNLLTTVNGNVIEYQHDANGNKTKQKKPYPVFSPTSNTSGLRAEYFDNEDLTGRVMVRTDANISFDWGEGSPAPTIAANTFSVRWTGQIVPLYSELYTFDMQTDDGVRLWIDGQLVIDSWETTAGIKTGTPISLIAGKHYDIQVEYYEHTGWAAAFLIWASPSQPRQIVPASQLSQSRNTLRGEYYRNKDLTDLAMTRDDYTIRFNWGNDSPAQSIPADLFSVRWTGKIQANYSEVYTFYMESDDGVRLWVDEKLIIDSWVNEARERTSIPIPLTANELYDIKIEYYEHGGGATAELRWSSPSQPKQVVPVGQFYQAYRGLKGEYYDNEDLTSLKMLRNDKQINFVWNEGSPASSIQPDTFSVRWTGRIEAPNTDTYTFYMESDDGVRLWINNTLIIDSWVTEARERTSLPIVLTAGQRYEFKVEYYEHTGSATARLWWSGQHQTKQIILEQVFSY